MEAKKFWKHLCTLGVAEGAETFHLERKGLGENLIALLHYTRETGMVKAGLFRIS